MKTFAKLDPAKYLEMKEFFKKGEELGIFKIMALENTGHEMDSCSLDKYDDPDEIIISMTDERDRKLTRIEQPLLVEIYYF